MRIYKAKIEVIMKEKNPGSKTPLTSEVLLDIDKVMTLIMSKYSLNGVPFTEGEGGLEIMDILATDTTPGDLSITNI